MGIVYFAHDITTTHSHLETPAGEGTVLWIVLISAIAAALALAAAYLLSFRGRKVQPQEQEEDS